MFGFDIITLVKKSYAEDSLGQKIPVETERTVFGRVESVSMTEFFEGGRIGLTPSYKAILTFAEDYEDEETAVLDGKRYAVYRTYKTPSGQMELYLQREKGA